MSLRTTLRGPGLVRVLVLALTTGALLLAACDGAEAGGAPSSPTPAPGIDVPDDAGSRPPSAWVSIDGATHVMALGTYCWSGVCADAVGIITPLDAVSAEAGVSLALEGELAVIDLTEVSWTLYPAPAEPSHAGDDWLAFHPQSEGVTLSVEEAAALPAALEPGRYVLALDAWQQGLDVHYGLLLVVD